MKFAFLLLLFLNPLWPIGETGVGDPFLIVNKKTNQMAYIEGGQIQKVFSVATGKTDKLTPIGKFTIVVKAENPYYRKKDIQGGDPKNPLGTRWMGFDAENTDGRIYGVHGNNNAETIGKYITQGCIRMYEEDVQSLFENIPIGTKIYITKSDYSFEQIGKDQGAIRK